jgi:hypothetical protein
MNTPSIPLFTYDNDEGSSIASELLVDRIEHSGGIQKERQS